MPAPGPEPIRPSSTAPNGATAGRGLGWLYAGLIVGAVALAWAGSLRAPFVLDDYESIVTNRSLESPGSMHWLTPPATGGETVAGRPVLNFTLALNHAVGGLEVRGYRLTNLALHVAAAWVAMAWLGLTLRRAGLAPTAAAHAAGLAALIWAVHPLQTAAVTYVVQRAESQAGLLYLVTLYAYARVVAAAGAAERRPWAVVAMTACLLGVGTKETVATAPLVAWGWDRTFGAGSLRSAWRERRGVLLGLAATWVPLSLLVGLGAGRGGSAGWGGEAGVSPWIYLWTQAGAVLHYLAQVFWPAGLVFDHGRALVDGLAAVAGQVAVVALALVVAAVAWSRGSRVGFAGLAFFVVLAPSSSVVPVVTQTIAEHRMYLPLLAVVAVVGWGLHRFATRVRWGGRGALGVGLAVVIALIVATRQRNETYASAVGLWQDTVAKRPGNARAHNNLGVAWRAVGDDAAAEAAFRRVLELDPYHAFAYGNLGGVYLDAGRVEAAIPLLQRAVEIDPRHDDARMLLAEAWQRLDRPEAAAAQWRVVVGHDPGALDARVNLAALEIDAGRGQAAADELRAVLRVNPRLAPAHHHLGRALERAGDARAAEAAYLEARRTDPGFWPAALALGNLLVGRGDRAGAEPHLRAALGAAPESASVLLAWGGWQAAGRELAAAQATFERLLALEPDHLEARANLGNCQLLTGRLREAIASYERVLRVRPDDQAVRENRDLALELLRQSRR